jgi:hypothetical protein
MKRILLTLIILSMKVFACSAPPATATTQPAVSETPLPTNTLPPTLTATQAATATETSTVTATLGNEGPLFPPNNVTCYGLSIYIDPSLAASTTCELIPASTEEMDLHPQYVNLTLQGYPLQDKFFPATISIYQVQAFADLQPDYVHGLVTDLQALLAGGVPGQFGLPFLPNFHAAQTFHSNYSLFPFLNGNGIRFLTLYAQYTAPVNNHDLFYTYQGLTADGQYWVSVIMPINLPILPANADNPPAGLTWEQFSANYEAYIVDMVAQLEAQPADSFTPTFAALDGMISTIVIGP